MHSWAGGNTIPFIIIRRYEASVEESSNKQDFREDSMTCAWIMLEGHDMLHDNVQSPLLDNNHGYRSEANGEYMDGTC